MTAIPYLVKYSLTAIAILVTFLYFYFTRHFNHWKNKNVPYIKPVPFFGNVFDGILMRHSMGEIFIELYNKTKDEVLGFFVLDRPCLLVKDPKIIKRILVTDFQYFFDRSILSNKQDDPVSAHILFILKNPEWKELRSKITPVFSSAKIKAMSQLIKEAAQRMIDYLNNRNVDENIVEMKEVSVKYTVDVITSTAFGINANAFKDNSEFCCAAKNMVNWDNFLTGFRMRCYFLAHSLVKLLKIKMFHPGAIKFLKKSFLDIMDDRATASFSRNDLIDILLQLKANDKYFRDPNILLSQAVVFFAAGFETSSSTINFALYELARYPEIQSKLRKEINYISNKHGGINYDSVKEMTYLDMCVKEVLRKYPVLAFLERKCNSNYIIPETGTVIDEGTPVFISVLALHYDPKYFPNPEIFDPERFSDKNKSNIDSFVYLPFGEGPRNCIGARFGTLTVKFGLSHILQNFNIYDSNKYEKIRFNPNGLVLSPLEGNKLRLEKRNNN